MPGLAILVSAVLVLLCGQTDRITDVAKRYTHATIVASFLPHFLCSFIVDYFCPFLLLQQRRWHEIAFYMLMCR